MRPWIVSTLAVAGSLAALTHGCDEYQPADSDDAGSDATTTPGSSPPPPGVDAANTPRCIRERIELNTVAVTPANTFTGDNSGSGTLTVSDAGITATVTSTEKNLFNLVLTSRGFTRRLGYPAKTVKIRFETTSQAVQSEAVLGCWIIHVDSSAGLDFSQAGFTYGGFVQKQNGRQLLRSRAPALKLGDNLDFGVPRAIGGPAQIVQLESVRDGDRVTFTGALESADGGLTRLPDGGTSSFVASGLAPLPTEIVCGVSVYDEKVTATATARWVEIDACP